MIDNFLLFKRK